MLKIRAGIADDLGGKPRHNVKRLKAAKNVTAEYSCINYRWMARVFNLR